MEISWLKIVNKTNDEIEIDLDGIIGWDEDSWPTIKKQLAEIASSKQKKLIVNIYSPGGFLGDGLMIHDALKISRAKIETRVFSMTASAATIIAQSGDTRKMSSNALYLIHRAANIAIGNVNDMRAAVDVLEKVDERIKDIYVKKGSDPEKIEQLMNEDNGNGKWIDADEALEVGLIDEIIEPTRAAASISKEFLDKYKLPQIPDSLMNKISLIEVNSSDATVTPKAHSFLSGIMASIKEFMKSDPMMDDVPVNVEPKPVSEPIIVVPEPEPVILEPSEPITVVNSEMEMINARLLAIETENADLKRQLSEAHTKLAQATAKSTILKGPEGKEGDEETKDEVKEETRKTLDAINKVMGGGYLENPKK